MSDDVGTGLRGPLGEGAAMFGEEGRMSCPTATEPRRHR